MPAQLFVRDVGKPLEVFPTGLPHILLLFLLTFPFRRGSAADPFIRTLKRPIRSD